MTKNGKSNKTDFKLDNSASARLDLIRFPMIVGVVFIHAISTTVGFAGQEVGVQETGFFVEFVTNLISRVFAGPAVPMFFLLSGFLFFYRFSWTRSGYLQKFRSRFNTLLVPFLFWNILVLVLFAAAQISPLTPPYFSGKIPPISEFPWLEYIDAIFGITRLPISYQFWFIRDLIIIVALTPFISVTISKIPYVALAFIATVWYLDLSPLDFPSAEALAFFYTGSLLAAKGISPFALDRYGKYIVGIYIAVAFVDAATKDMALNAMLSRAGLVLGVVSALYLTKSLLGREFLRSRLAALSMTSFFVFAAHEPLLSATRNVAFRVLDPSSDLFILGLYFFSPAFVVIVLVYTYRVLRIVLPTPTRFVSGGRNFTTNQSSSRFRIPREHESLSAK